MKTTKNSNRAFVIFVSCVGFVPERRPFAVNIYG